MLHQCFVQQDKRYDHEEQSQEDIHQSDLPAPDESAWDDDFIQHKRDDLFHSLPGKKEFRRNQTFISMSEILRKNLRACLHILAFSSR